MASEDHAAAKHYRVGPGRCNCGFDAYKFKGIMLDYHEMLMAHLRAALERDRACDRAAKKQRTDDLAAEQEAMHRHAEEAINEANALGTDLHALRAYTAHLERRYMALRNERGPHAAANHPTVYELRDEHGVTTAMLGEAGDETP